MNFLTTKNVTAAVYVAAVLSSSHTFAGAVTDVPVSITPNAFDTEFTQAAGNMFSARNAANELEFIGCELVAENAILNDLRGRGFEDGFYGSCQAQDAAGTVVACETSNPDMLEVIGSISSYSYIQFFFDPTITTGIPRSDLPVCASIKASNRSFYLPLTAEDKDKVNTK